MRAPDEDLRSRVATDWSLRSDLADEQGESRLGELLEDIERMLDQELKDPRPNAEVTRENAEEQLAAVDGWAALISSAVARVYAPASPWSRRKAGWADDIAKRLRRVAQKLRPVLERISSALGAVGFSIAVSFPWGISIGMSFDG